MQLYAVHDAIEVLLATKVDRQTGEITEETLKELESLEIALEEKALAVAAYLKGEIAEAEAVEREADKLMARAHGHRNRAESLRKYLERYVPKEVNWKDARTTLKWKLNPPKVEILDREKLPRTAFRTVPARKEVDKKSVLSRLKAGKKVPGAQLVQGSRLEVR